ncbi:hypothetical protein GRX03_07010 [Halovenus sp. WSH3]|uniref:Uncharacterized protein n=1 Tax=Halovenus carboxidivorans TaxID=2692199 RepID=A0A6B0T056_9EURY|nr:hypothetical protein [Halovenus carboxidivorans]MXR51354.1 hypothetical protein [Halovenus carboxidivorans]
MVLQAVYASMSVFESDERTDNPTVITDSLLIHPEDHAEWMDGMRTIFRLHTLLVVQNLATKQGDRVNGRMVYRELNRIYEDEEIYRQRVYDALDWHVEHNLLTRRDIGPGGKVVHSYQLTPHGKGVLKRHAELILGMINGEDYETIVHEGLDLSE